MYLSSFHELNINYCQWKSNDHVAEGLCGITDLDILVDRRHQADLISTLAAHGFKRGNSSFRIQYPAVEGYVGLDQDTGKMAYFHVHYCLILGKFRIKEYSFGWEKQYLSSRVFDKTTGVYVADPNFEIILLLVRAALKVRTRDRWAHFFGRKYFDGNWMAQYDWLLDRIDTADSVDLFRTLLGERGACPYERMLADGVSLKMLLSMRAKIQDHLVLYETYGKAMTTVIIWLRGVLAAVAGVNRRYLGRKLPFIRKTPSTGGLLVAFIGSDGSGKSTVTKKIVSDLSWKLDAVHVYLGAGKGSISWFRSIILRARKKAIKAGRFKSGDLREKPDSPGGKFSVKSALYSPARMIWALMIAREKRPRLKSAWRARNQGLIVISDRYPQNQITGFNDGPLLKKWEKDRSLIKRLISRREGEPYLWAEKRPPDLVIRLRVSPEVAAERDSEITPEYAQKRIDAVNSLSFGDAPIIEVDANRSIEEVLIDAKNVIWGHL